MRGSVRAAGLAAGVLLALGAEAGAGGRSTLGRLGTETLVEPFDAYAPLVWSRSDAWWNGPGYGCAWHADNVRIVRGTLELALTSRPTKGLAYACAEYQTRKHYGFGRYEVRLRAARGDGVATAFTLFTGQPFGDRWDEVKLTVLGEDTRRAHLGLFARGVFHDGGTVDLGFDAADGFHDYTLDWQPDRIAVTVDGRAAHSYAAPAEEMPAAPCRIHLQLWNGDDSAVWMKPFTDPGRPLTAAVDRLRYTALPAAQLSRTGR